MTEIDLDKLYEFEHSEDFSMTPEQFKMNLLRKITRLDIMSKFYNHKPCEEEALNFDR
jgi:hypothetical protein